MRSGLDTKMYNSVATAFSFAKKDMFLTSLDEVSIAPAYLRVEGTLARYLA